MRSDHLATGQMRDQRWVLGVLYALVGAANLVRGFLAFKLVPVFVDWSLALPLPLLGVVYFSCGVLFLTALIAIVWRFDDRARQFIRVSGIVYQAVIWMIHVVGDRSSYARARWPQDAVVTAGFLVIVFLLTTSSGKQRDDGYR